MTAKLPKGIRWRGGDSLLVQVYRNGQRPSDTLRRNPDEADAAFIARARARRIEMEVELLSAAPDTPAPTAATQCWTLRQALERVRTTDKADGGWSGSRSVTDALRNAEHVLAYFGPDRTLDTIDAEHIREFRKALTDAGAKNTTANRKVAALSKLLTFAAERPRASGLAHRPKFPKQLDEKGSRRRSAPSPEQEVELLRTMRAQGEHAAADVVEVLFDTGMRVGEVWGIRPRHVDLAAGTLLLTGTNDDGTKNGEFRSIPLPARTERIVRARLSVTDKDAALFPYNYDWLRWRWDKARKVMGLMGDRNFVRHGARHAFISDRIGGGKDSAVVQEWVGHKTAEMTKRYTHLRTRHLRALIDAPAEEKSAGASPDVVAILSQFVAKSGVDQETLINTLASLLASKSGG